MNHLILIGVGVAVLLVLIVLLVAISLRTVVPTNKVHIVQSRSATTSFGKNRSSGNVYYAWPSWLPFIGVTTTNFPESVFDVTLKDYEAYDSGRLPFRVDVMAFFRVEDSDIAAHRVANFEELLNQLHGILQGAVRRVLSIHPLEEIMQDRSTLGDTFTNEVTSQLKEWGVTTVKNIEFMDIRDSVGSEVIHNIMAKEKSRIERESRIAVAENEQEAQNKEIDANRQVELQRQLAAEQVGTRTAEADKAIGIAQQQSRQEILTQETETATREMAVKQIRDVREAEIERDVAVVETNQEKSVIAIRAEAEKQRIVTTSEGELAAANNTATAIRVKGEAEGAAKTAILLADVAPQITLAKEIGENTNYQTYLLDIRRIESDQAIGVANAGALSDADIKVIVTGGDAQSGISSIGDLMGAKGGAAMTQLVSALAATEEGKAVLNAVTGSKVK